ncbi:hypothetical protein FHR90_003129 [Endobacter medicaginis]|uniref:Uncharacterized protein n=1 Tax=Endobacter medicaginis TaxID=1181271 RepID=A0A850NR48_9PROT|nr:hypothetical protein [Endobacter medicaginis]MBB3175275.1 hypothetical protein [Endobacter medicaginis]MCX5476941.1 hypothetical protein [Endobacter medicaginis]NVN29438.1 hypothetical protein [Endobacter medicaginis]
MPPIELNAPHEVPTSSVEELGAGDARIGTTRLGTTQGTEHEAGAFQAAYDATRQYHLTSEAGKESIRNSGFDKAFKSGNSAEVFGLPKEAVDEAAANHYVASTRPRIGRTEVTSGDRLTAKRLPTVVTTTMGNHDPKVVRVMVDPSTLKPDSFFPSPRGYNQIAHMMPDQPREAVLRAHGEEPLAEAVERYRLSAEQHLGRPVSSEEARENLMHYQTDSEHDGSDLESP